MKESTSSGLLIYEDIKETIDQLSEIEKALYEIENVLGTTSIAYIILSDKKSDLKQSYQTLIGKKYKEVGGNVF